MAQHQAPRDEALGLAQAGTRSSRELDELDDSILHAKASCPAASNRHVGAKVHLSWIALS